MRDGLRAVCCAIVLMAAACGTPSAEDHDDPLGEILVQPGALGDDYEPVHGPSGPMMFEDAARATVSESQAMATAMNDAGFNGAYARMWRHDDAHAVAVVYELAGAEDARAIVEMQRREIAIRGGFVFIDEQVPTGFGYGVGGTRRSDSSDPLFCQGYWFVARRLAFMVQTCAPGPGGFDFARGMALAQLERLQDAAL